MGTLCVFCTGQVEKVCQMEESQIVEVSKQLLDKPCVFKCFLVLGPLHNYLMFNITSEVTLMTNKESINITIAQQLKPITLRITFQNDATEGNDIPNYAAG